ncbi:MAG: NADP-dependent oxidoreductase domain-containing protein [Benjaminiella poitrasii]|nr:MAG: NADP-dependent oxidoreductase domain-containing protein [Benjaminiella poitrasii]
MSFKSTVTLNNGVVKPMFGLGTWQSKPNEVYNAVLTALKAGYTHIDTAYVYRNEKEIGQAIKDSGIPRQQLFITTKLWNTSHQPDLVEKALDASLANLQLDYIDLYLMHWPVAFKPSKYNIPKDENGNIAIDHSVHFVDTYASMEKLIQSGKVRAIGVSNFSIRNLEHLLNHCKIPPAVNQVEIHPYLPQSDLIKYCQQHNVHVTAYSPLGSTDSPIMQEPTVLNIAKKHNNATPAQVLLSWGLQRGLSVIPKSVTPSRIISNFHVFKLEKDEFEALERLASQESKRLIDPSPFWGVDIYNDAIIKPKL